jgi:uracil-DNA glycosylase family 4
MAAGVLSKAQQYEDLVAARKSCVSCEGLVNASSLADGVFDSDEIGPWSRWLGDRSPRVMVIGQDWGDQRAFEKQQGGNLAYSATNEVLRELLESIGFAVPKPAKTPASARVFLTNAVLCFKDQGCQGPVRDRWFENCGQRFLRPQIELLSPKVVVCLGERAFRAVLSAYGISVSISFRTAVEGAGISLSSQTTAFAVYHCGRRILNSHRAREAQFRDWQRIKASL